MVSFEFSNLIKHIENVLWCQSVPDFDLDVVDGHHVKSRIVVELDKFRDFNLIKIQSPVWQ